MAGLSKRDVQGLRRRAGGMYLALMPRHQHAPRLSPPHPWRALTERELRFCWPDIEALCLHERGRPAGLDVLSRFEACLEAACSGLSWREMRVGGMRGDTLHRCFRRWSAAGLWMRLLRRLAEARLANGEQAGGRWAALEYFVCRAYRRAWRVQGLRGIVLARLLGMRSALRAPMGWLPDPILSARVHQGFILPGLKLLPRMPWPVARSFLRLARRLTELCRGRARIPRGWEPA